MGAKGGDRVILGLDVATVTVFSLLLALFLLLPRAALPAVETITHFALFRCLRPRPLKSLYDLFFNGVAMTGNL